MISENIQKLLEIRNKMIQVRKNNYDSDLLFSLKNESDDIWFNKMSEIEKYSYIDIIKGLDLDSIR